MNHMIQDRLKQQQQADAQQRRQRIRALEIKIDRCISEVSWRFFPTGGPRAIDIDAAEQLMLELFDALRDLRRIDQREGGHDGTAAIL